MPCVSEKRVKCYKCVWQNQIAFEKAGIHASNSADTLGAEGPEFALTIA